MVGDKNFLLQLVERWKTLLWERSISMYDITQHKQITYEKCFFLYHKLGWDME